ncbi:MAG: class I SAM-dependent DNA methyltransferase [Solirubrobacteraceae bacterium]
MTASGEVAGPDHARRAYDAFAPYYDAFTAHHDYESWTASLEGLARQAGLSGRRLLDLACGTGKSFLPFLDRGYRVTACDISPAMLDLARRRANGRAQLLEADVRDLPALGAFDLVTFLDDAVNYLDSAAELEAAFAGIARNLAPGGVLVFDANTLATFRRLYSSCLVVQAEGRVLTLRGRGSDRLAPGGLAVAHLDALVEQSDGWWSETRSVHRHRHHPEATIRAALEHAGLRCVAAHGQHLDGRVDPVADDLRHSKVVYLATR